MTGPSLPVQPNISSRVVVIYFSNLLTWSASARGVRALPDDGGCELLLPPPLLVRRRRKKLEIAVAMGVWMGMDGGSGPACVRVCASWNRIRN